MVQNEAHKGELLEVESAEDDLPAKVVSWGSLRSFRCPRRPMHFTSYDDVDLFLARASAVAIMGLMPKGKYLRPVYFMLVLR